jgi:predicted DNA binding CopG/RHH family protein
MKLDKEEKELLKSIENGEWRSTDNLDKDIEKARAIARATGTKNERMNIRMNRRDMMALKTRALERGVPYQTLVSSILRQWLRGESVARKSRTSAVRKPQPLVRD